MMKTKRLSISVRTLIIADATSRNLGSDPIMLSWLKSYKVATKLLTDTEGILLCV